MHILQAVESGGTRDGAGGTERGREGERKTRRDLRSTSPHVCVYAIHELFGRGG
jgi:hypothetical protein